MGAGRGLAGRSWLADGSVYYRETREEKEKLRGLRITSLIKPDL